MKQILQLAWRMIGISLAFIFLLVPLLQAQERGQYLPGFSGLNSGIQAPPGFTYANYFFWYPSDRLNDSNGDEVRLDVELDLVADFSLFVYTTKAKFLGANYGMAVGIPFVNTAIGLGQLGGLTTGGIGDIYVEPVNLGWAKPGAYNIKVAYGFIAPTGKFDEDGTETTTTDYWGHEFTFATTRALGQTKLWQLSVNTNWEFHQKKRHEDVKVGNNMTLEYGVGKTIVKNQGKQLIQVGAVGYAEFQLTDDSGSDVSAFNRGNQDHAFGLGGEFGVIWPVSKFNFLVRVIPEFGVRSRTQGLTFVVAAGKSF